MTKLSKSLTAACQDCPWRKSNQGKPHPHGWFTKKNLQRLWGKIRDGETMSCHRTDPNNVVPDGGKPVPGGTIPAECAGMALLVQRELRRLEPDPLGYDRRSPNLSKRGILYWAFSRCGPLAGTVVGGVPMLLIEEDPDVYYAPLAKAESRPAD